MLSTSRNLRYLCHLKFKILCNLCYGHELTGEQHQLSVSQSRSTTFLIYPQVQPLPSVDFLTLCTKSFWIDVSIIFEPKNSWEKLNAYNV